VFTAMSLRLACLDKAGQDTAKEVDMFRSFVQLLPVLSLLLIDAPHLSAQKSAATPPATAEAEVRQAIR